MHSKLHTQVPDTYRCFNFCNLFFFSKRYYMLIKVCSLYNPWLLQFVMCYTWILQGFHDGFLWNVLSRLASQYKYWIFSGRRIEKWSEGQLIKRIIWLLKTREDASHLPSFLQYWSIYALILFVLLLCWYCCALVE